MLKDRWLDNDNDGYPDTPIFIQKKKETNKAKKPKPEPEPIKTKKRNKATLIKLEDQRQILCNLDIGNLMLEFAKAFNAQIYTITFDEPQEIELLDLEKVAEFISEGKSTTEIPPHQITTILLKPEEPTVDGVPRTVQNHIAQCLGSREAEKRIIKIEDLILKFPEVNRKILEVYLGNLANKIIANGWPKIEYNEKYLKVI